LLRRFVTAGVVVAVVSMAVVAPAGAKTDEDDVMWFDPKTGTTTVWVQESPRVYHAQTLAMRCPATDCTTWKPVGVDHFGPEIGADVLWYDPVSGQLSITLLQWGAVVGTRPLSWRCDAASGCAAAWRPIGTGDIDNDGSRDVLWFNKTTGQVSAWLLADSGTVRGTRELSWRCDAASGCSNTWQPVTVDHITGGVGVDVLWFNETTGQLSSWRTDGTGTVTGTQELSWRCSAASGCSAAWEPIGFGDLSNNDGQYDLLWRNRNTGQLSAWLLERGGVVSGSRELAWKCDGTHGCSADSAGVGIKVIA
jgi:hypothetical protein